MNFNLKAMASLASFPRYQPGATFEERLAGYSERAAKMLASVSQAQKRAKEVMAERRRCTGTKADGLPCKSWAVWEADEQKCLSHLSPKARLEHEIRRAKQSKKAPRPKCDCDAYPFPHRPANGFCVAPEVPKVIHPLPAGKRKTGKRRRRDQKRARCRTCRAA